MMKKLLLADDSITIQKVVGIIFSTEEYQLQITDNGDSAFSQALEEIPDLVIADISMPGKDGFELCRAIKSEPVLAKTSVLLLPGAFDHFDEIKAGEVCADGWLTKPFESQALLDKVSQLLQTEPARIVGIVAPVTVEEGAPVISETADPDGDLPVNESVLGLENVEELSALADEADEESVDDIWDAVSFAEEDLAGQSELIGDETEDEDEGSSAAEVIDPSIAEPVSAVEDFAPPPPAEAAGTESIEDFQPEPFADVATAGEDLSDQIESASELDSLASSEESEAVDFSVFSGTEDAYQPSAEEETGTSTYYIDDEENEEVPGGFSEVEAGFTANPEKKGDIIHASDNIDPLELIGDDQVEEKEGGVADFEPEAISSVVESDNEDSVLDLLDEVVPLEPIDASVEPDINVADTEADDDDFIIELQQEDELDSLMQDAELSSVVEDGNETPEEEEILDLSVEEIVEGEISAVEDIDSEEIEPLPAATPEPVAEVFVLSDEGDELTDDIETVAAVDTDEDFYFDAAAEAGDDAVIEPLSQIDSKDSAAEMAEQQLRELSDEELKEVLTKVAEPMIEKMASEILERIAWDVVPDLAEAMISEEIRKIKEGE